MNSTANSIEVLYEKAKIYAETSLNLLALNVIDKTANAVSTLASRIFIAMAVAMFTLFLNIGISLYIGALLGQYYLGFLIVSIFYLIVVIALYGFKEKLIETPLANLIITKLLLSKRTGAATMDEFKKSEHEHI